MCTVSFFARRSGYLVGMNRDEKLTRATGLPPRLWEMSGAKVLAPAEPDGGFWIALSEARVTFALINWYTIPLNNGPGMVSRGNIVRSLAPTITARAAQAAIEREPLARMNAFRLIGIFPQTREILEWRWDRTRLACIPHAWEPGVWISSGYDEPTAERIRSATFRRALRQSGAGTVAWLRRLHRASTPAPGPFSILMRRPDAATVSITEIRVSPGIAAMRHTACSPEAGPGESSVVELKLPPDRS